MAQLGQREHLDEPRVFLVEAMAQEGELVLGELPVLPLRRFPVVGRHRIEESRGLPVWAGGWRLAAAEMPALSNSRPEEMSSRDVD